MASTVAKKFVLAALLLLPVSMYLGSLVISGAVTFRTLENLGPGPTAEGSDLRDFSLVQSNGSAWTADSMQGKIAVVSFFFSSCPTVCPGMNFHLKQAHDRMFAFKDIVFVSFSIDPETDTPEVLEAYKERFGVGQSPKWKFITGDREAIYQLAKAYYLTAMADSNADGGFTHSQSAVIVDWNGNLRSRFDDQNQILGAYDVSQPVQVDELVEDLRVLVKEYRQEKMGL
jgi:protein SCO1/2